MVGTEATTAQSVLKFFTENPAPPDEYRTPTHALELLAHYRVRKSLPDYQWNVLNDSSGLLVERAFELPLGVLEVNAELQLPRWPEKRYVRVIHIAWSGRIDLVAECNFKNRIVDNKTTSIAGDQFIQSFRLSSQTIGYVWAGRQLWPDLNIDGFCLNAMHLKKPAAGKGLMEIGPRGGPPALNFFRAFFDYSDERIEEWQGDTMLLIEDFVHSLIRGRFPLNDRHCFDKFGMCPYYDVDAIDEQDVRLRLLMSAFKDVRMLTDNMEDCHLEL
jgi:hypothetical protein